MPNGIGSGYRKKALSLFPSTKSLMVKIILTKILKRASKRKCTTRINGLMYLNSRERSMLCLLPNTTKVIVYGIAQKRTAPGAARGMQFQVRQNETCSAIFLI